MIAGKKDWIFINPRYKDNLAFQTRYDEEREQASDYSDIDVDRVRCARFSPLSQAPPPMLLPSPQPNHAPPPPHPHAHTHTYTSGAPFFFLGAGLDPARPPPAPSPHSSSSFQVDLLQYPQVARIPWEHATVSAGDCVFVPYQYLHQV